MLNKITIMGWMTRDPELRLVSGEIPVCSFVVAVDRNSKDKETDFFDCTAWRKDAEFISKHFKKNSMIAVSGRMEFRPMEKNGVMFKKGEIQVEEYYFGDNRLLKHVEHNIDQKKQA